MCSVFVYLGLHCWLCICILCFFYLAAFKRHYALRLAIAPEFFNCSYMCLFYVCSLGCWNEICNTRLFLRTVATLLQRMAATAGHSERMMKHVLWPLRWKDWETFCGFRGQQKKRNEWVLNKAGAKRELLDKRMSLRKLMNDLLTDSWLNWHIFCLHYSKHCTLCFNVYMPKCSFLPWYLTVVVWHSVYRLVQLWTC